MRVRNWDWLVRQFIGSAIQRKKKLNRILYCSYENNTVVIENNEDFKKILKSEQIFASCQYNRHSSRCSILHNVTIFYALKLHLKIKYSLYITLIGYLETYYLLLLLLLVV